MTVAELKAKIKSEDLAGAYIFAGEEDYLKKYYLSEIGKIACPDEAFALFSRSVFDGEDVSVLDIAEAIKAPPMMADYKLVEWRYPNLDKMTEAARGRLIELASSLSEYPYAILVLFCDEDGFDAGTAKRPSKLAKRLSESFGVVNFEKSTDAQLIGWLKRHFDANSIAVSQDTLQALIFRSGHSMQTLKNEVDKLSAYAKANSLTAITPKQINLVASPTLECDAFALSTAITDKRRDKAFVALMDMKMRRIESGAVLATLQRAFSELCVIALLLEEGKGASDIESVLKWNPYKIKISIAAAKKWGAARLAEAKERLRVLDAESKSGGISGYKSIEIFICQFI